MQTLMVNDPMIASRLIAERKAQQADRYDEVWDGVYIMSPMANNEHQGLATELAIVIGTAVDWQGIGQTLSGANVSDRRDDWTKNYRVPDVLVFSGKTSAEDCGSHWLGGPELAIEIFSPGDRTLEKLDFYAKVGTQELLVIDRDPWQLTLYRSNAEAAQDQPRCLRSVASSTMANTTRIEVQTFPLAFMLSSNPRSIEVSHADGKRIRSIPIRDQPQRRGRVED